MGGTRGVTDGRHVGEGRGSPAVGGLCTVANPAICAGSALGHDRDLVPADRDLLGLVALAAWRDAIFPHQLALVAGAQLFGGAALDGCHGSRIGDHQGDLDETAIADDAALGVPDRNALLVLRSDGFVRVIERQRLMCEAGHRIFGEDFALRPVDVDGREIRTSNFLPAVPVDTRSGETCDGS